MWAGLERKNRAAGEAQMAVQVSRRCAGWGEANNFGHGKLELNSTVGPRRTWNMLLGKTIKLSKKRGP